MFASNRRFWKKIAVNHTNGYTSDLCDDNQLKKNKILFWKLQEGK